MWLLKTDDLIITLEMSEVNLIQSIVHQSLFMWPRRSPDLHSLYFITGASWKKGYIQNPSKNSLYVAATIARLTPTVLYYWS